MFLIWVTYEIHLGPLWTMRKGYTRDKIGLTHVFLSIFVDFFIISQMTFFEEGLECSTVHKLCSF